MTAVGIPKRRMKLIALWIPVANLYLWPKYPTYV
jgi:hypothetical protein